jgi:hypothetical protein
METSQGSKSETPNRTPPFRLRQDKFAAELHSMKNNFAINGISGRGPGAASEKNPDAASQTRI